jgi:hypothetical protein
MSTENPQKIPQKNECNLCDYFTFNLKDFKKHCNTKKHIINTLSTKSTEKSPNYYSYNSKKIYICEYCNKEYKERSGLWRHKQKCNMNNELIDKEEITINNDKTLNVILELVKQNSEFKELISEQNKYIVSQNQNLQTHFIELSKEKVTMNNCNNTNNITNNNQFNLNLFLNETCKNAMNINEFCRTNTINNK